MQTIQCNVILKNVVINLLYTYTHAYNHVSLCVCLCARVCEHGVGVHGECVRQVFACTELIAWPCKPSTMSTYHLPSTMLDHALLPSRWITLETDYVMCVCLQMCVRMCVN